MTPPLSTQPGENPLLSPSNLPYQMPAFDQIRDSHYGPAFAFAMQEHLQEILQIAQNRQAPTFENTLVALERSGQLLTRVKNLFYNLNSLITNDQMQALERELAPKLSAHQDAIMLNPLLFARIASLHQQQEQLQLDPESLRLLQRQYRNFVRAGAQLDQDAQDKLKRMNIALAEIKTRFNQNVLKEVQADALLIEDVHELAGLDEDEIKALADAANAAGHPGKYLLPLTNTTQQPFNTRLQQRSMRQRLHTVSVARGAHGSAWDNREWILALVKLRTERAQLLGYANYACQALEEETARTPQAVNDLLAELTPAALANARREAADIAQIMQADTGDSNATPAAWDWDYYSEKVRMAHYAFDANELRPYFELHSVLKNGAFYTASELYGLSFTLRPDLPVYHPDVEVYEVKEADGRPLALFLIDFYARPNKRGGAWMNEYLSQSRLLGNLPVVGNHLNIPRPPAGKPTLLTHDEVVTLFHEFGHALHGMLSNVHYPSFAGTSVPRDFVEYPSKLYEMWVQWPQVLKNYARHYETGAEMPQALLDKLLASQQFNQGYGTTEYLAAALLDQRWHQLTLETLPQDVLAFEAQALQQAGIDYAPVPPRYRSTYFSHIFGGGYAAGYYAYLWSEKLDADTEQWFKENGGLTRANGQRLRDMLLSRGNSGDAMELYQQFRGRAAEIAPLLARRGLHTAAAGSDKENKHGN